jgi:hypothetical protein
VGLTLCPDIKCLTKKIKWVIFLFSTFYWQLEKTLTDCFKQLYIFSDSVMRCL